MTAVEFMHQFRRAGRTVQVQAALYYLKHYQSKPQAKVAEALGVLTESRMPNAKKVNYRQALAGSAPYVRSVAHGVWEITGTGEKRLEAEHGVTRPKRGAIQADIDDLRAIAAGVKDRFAREYIEEAVRCLEVDARRAFVVFLWTGAVSAIREEVWRFGSKAIQSALQAHNPRAKFRKKGDFENVKDADLLQIAHDMEIFDKSQKKRLAEGLDLRNDCGHPAKFSPGEKKVQSFVEDVVATVWPSPAHEAAAAA